MPRRPSAGATSSTCRRSGAGPGVACLAHLQQEFDGTVWNDVVRITGTGELLAELQVVRIDSTGPVSVACQRTVTR
ncbi:MAG: hypothetical protein R2705_08540 [Ilumatobacteraceae bacterium]